VCVVCVCVCVCLCRYENKETDKISPLYHDTSYMRIYLAWCQ